VDYGLTIKGDLQRGLLYTSINYVSISSILLFTLIFLSEAAFVSFSLKNKMMITMTMDNSIIVCWFFGRPYYRSRLWYSMSSVCLSSVICDVLYSGETAGPICVKFSGKVWSDHGTTWLHFGSIRINRAMPRFVCRLSVTFCILAKRLDWFAWNFQGRCGVTMGGPDYILGQFG